MEIKIVEKRENIVFCRRKGEEVKCWRITFEGDEPRIEEVPREEAEKLVERSEKEMKRIAEKLRAEIDEMVKEVEETMERISKLFEKVLG